MSWSRKPIQAWQFSIKSPSSYSSPTAPGAKENTGSGNVRSVAQNIEISKPTSAHTNTQSREQLKQRPSSANVPSSRERSGNSHIPGTTSGDRVREKYQNYLKPNDDHRWKDGDTSTDSTRSVHNTSHNTNIQDNSLFTAGKSSDRAHGTYANDEEPLKQRYAKSAWTGSSNQYREENSAGIDIKRPTYNVRDVDTSDTHITEGDRHFGYNDRSFNTKDTDLTNTVELIKTIKSIAPLADKSWIELTALQRKDTKIDSEHMKQQVETLQKETAKLEDEKKNWQIEMKKVVQERDQALAQLKERDLELEREKATHNEHLNMLQQCKNELAILGNENRKMQDELVRKKAQYDKLQEDNTQVKAELADYKTRLSMLMGSRLSDNNPDIADLSDRNRPTKLAEKYQELYDNEWTDAFEVFESHFKDESKAIKSLKMVLEHVKKICDELSQDQSKMLIESLTMTKTQGGSVSKDIMKQLKDLRRSSAESSLEGVLEQYIKQVDELRASGNELANLVLNEGIRPFIRGCVQLCWLMTVQDPPLLFGPDPDSSQPIDTNTYKFYTKTGTCIDYVVWPPLFLYKDGPLLYKGIAQGHTPASEKLPRERRREQVSSTTGRTTYNSSSRQTAIPAAGSSSPGQSKVNDYNSEKEGYKQKQSNESGQKISGDEKGTGANSTSRGNTTDESYSASSQIPTREEWRIFLNIGRTYGLDSIEVKATLGDRYQVCLDYYYRQIRQRSKHSTNI